MTPMIKIELDGASMRYVSKIRDASKGAQGALLKVIDLQNQLTIADMTRNRLSKRGRETLGVVTNRLRSSMRASKAKLSAGGGIESAIGSNVVYAGVHEFGFDGDVNVRAYTRRIFDFVSGVRGASVDMKTGRIKKPKKLKIVKSEVEVRAHTRHMKFPARAPIERTIEARLPIYRDAIQAKIIELAS